MAERWYATSRFELGKARRQAPGTSPGLSVVHAKRLGTIKSACGLDTSSWKKYWTSFDRADQSQMCCECVQIIAALRRESHTHPA